MVSRQDKTPCDCSHGWIIRRNVRLAMGFRARRRFTDQKYGRTVFPLTLTTLLPHNIASECPEYSSYGCSCFSHHSASFRFFSFLLILFICRFFAVPSSDAIRCNLRIIKVVANLDWRELLTHSLAKAHEGNWCSHLDETSAGSLIGRAVLRERK